MMQHLHFHTLSSRRLLALLLTVGTLQQAPAFAETSSSSEAQAAGGEVDVATAEATSLTSCADAYEQAQTEKLELKYKKARETAQLCSQLECSVPAITQECVRLYEQLGTEIPTLVFSAKTWDGHALVEVSVHVNGELLMSGLDGTSLSLDPGTYEFSFETPGYPAQTATHVARVGDSNRLIEVVFGEPPPKPDPAPVASPIRQQAPAPVRQDSSIPTASYVLAGTSLVAFGAFGYLRLTGISDYNRLNSECSPNCDAGEVDDLRSKFKLSYLPLGIGIAALGGATAVYVFGRDSTDSARTEVGVAPGFGGASAHLRTRF